MKRIRWALAATFILLMASGAAFFLIKQGKMQGPATPAHNEGNCGLDCLLRICHQNEILISAEDLRANYGTSNLSSFLEIKEAAEKLGFIAKGYRMDFGEMKKAEGHIICHLKGNHFVVIEGFKDDKVQIFSPPKKVRVIPTEQFLDQWDGYVLLIITGDN